MRGMTEKRYSSALRLQATTFTTGNNNNEETAWPACGPDCRCGDLPYRHAQPD
jgi:hypothetical protein